MKNKRPKLKMPRVTWHIKPMERVKDDETKYNRNIEKRRLRKDEQE